MNDHERTVKRVLKKHMQRFIEDYAQNFYVQHDSRRPTCKQIQTVMYDEIDGHLDLIAAILSRPRPNQDYS